MAPTIIDRASTAAYDKPDRDAASASVVSATEGAAANTPAKLFGLNRSPSSANVATTAPPIANRMTISHMSTAVAFRLPLPCADAVLDDLPGAAGTLAPEHAI